MMRTQPAGMAMLVVIAVMAVGALLLAAAMSHIVDNHRQCRLRHQHRQCRLLAAAGIDRGTALLAGDEYQGETWQLAAEDSGLDKPTAVTIAIDPSSKSITATVRYPAVGTPRVSYTAQRNME